MALPNSDLFLALSTLTASPETPYTINGPSFSLPSPRHGCVGGKLVRVCRVCAGSGRQPCLNCLNKGFITSTCPLCLESLANTSEAYRARLDSDQTNNDIDAYVGLNFRQEDTDISQEANRHNIDQGYKSPVVESKQALSPHAPVPARTKIRKPTNSNVTDLAVRLKITDDDDPDVSLSPTSTTPEEEEPAEQAEQTHTMDNASTTGNTNDTLDNVVQQSSPSPFPDARPLVQSPSPPDSLLECPTGDAAPSTDQSPPCSSLQAPLSCPLRCPISSQSFPQSSSQSPSQPNHSSISPALASNPSQPHLSREQTLTEEEQGRRRAKVGPNSPISLTPTLSREEIDDMGEEAGDGTDEWKDG